MKFKSLQYPRDSGTIKAAPDETTNAVGHHDVSHWCKVRSLKNVATINADRIEHGETSHDEP
jgi:hypothetical protein